MQVLKEFLECRNDPFPSEPRVLLLISNNMSLEAGQMEVIPHPSEAFGSYAVSGWMVAGTLNISYDGEICRPAERGTVSSVGLCVSIEDCEASGKGEAGSGWRRLPLKRGS
jgi:hypothetical protein